MKCKICGKPASGSPADWRCSASKYHYWRWRTNHLRQAKKAWEATLTPYERQVLSAFKSDKARAQFLDQHAPAYPAGA